MNIQELFALLGVVKVGRYFILHRLFFCRRYFIFPTNFWLVKTQKTQRI